MNYTPYTGWSTSNEHCGLEQNFCDPKKQVSDCAIADIQIYCWRCAIIRNHHNFKQICVQYFTVDYDSKS